MASIGALTVDVRVTIDGKNTSRWRIRILGWVAHLLGVSLRAEAHSAPPRPQAPVWVGNAGHTTDVVLLELKRRAQMQYGDVSRWSSL